jgi:tetratricopeptide (TPR) repeat protein
LLSAIDHRQILQLLKAAPSVRLLKVRNGRLANEGSCRALLEHGYSLRYSEPQRYADEADLALAVAQTLATRKATCRSLEALARAHRGNAHRILGDFPRAAQDLAEAERLPLTIQTEARLWEFKGSLYLALSDYFEALSVLWRAEAIRSADGDRLAWARVLIQIGVALVYKGDPHGAVKHLRHAIRLSDGDPDTLRNATQPLIWALVDKGDPQLAHGLLHECRDLFEAGQPLFRLRVRWVQARVEAALGSIFAARVTFETARQGFFNAGLCFDLALISLDLATLEAEAGAWGRAAELSSEIIPLVRSLGLGVESRAAELLEAACQRQAATLFRAVTALLRQPKQLAA